MSWSLVFACILTLIQNCVGVSVEVLFTFLLVFLSPLGRTRDNRSPLQLAIGRRLSSVVEVLCQRGADLNTADEFGTTPLWSALMSKQTDIAATLVSFAFC